MLLQCLQNVSVCPRSRCWPFK